MSRYLVFIAMHLVMLLASVSINTVSVAFEEITRSLDTTLVIAGWVMSIYLLVYTVSVVLMGKISEIFGRKQTFLACVGFFIIGSLLAGLSPNIQTLIAARFIQAIGAGGFVPATMGVITDSFPDSRQKMVGISISIFNIGGIIGPSIGAWLVSSFSWRAVFWFNVPFGLLALIPVIFLLKKDQPHPSRIDFIGAGLLAAALFGVMVGVSLIDTENSPLEWVIACVLFALGILSFLLFLRHIRRDKEPIVDPPLMGRQPFLSVNFYNFIFGSSVFSFSSLIPLFITSVYAMTTYHSGIILGVRSAGNILASVTASFMVTRWSYRKQILTGTILISASTILMAIQPHGFSLGGLHISDFTLMCLLGFVSGVAFGVVSPALLNAIVDIMPEKTSTLSGLGSMFRQSGGAIFIAVITVIVQSSGTMSSGFLISFLMLGILILSCLPFLHKIPNRQEIQAR
jgi:MFS family permease